MAPLATVEPTQLPSVLRRVEERLRQEASPTSADELWAATYLLLGLRYDDRTVSEVVTRMSWLQESSTYQAIRREGLAEGRAVGQLEGRAEGRVDTARRFILDLGSDKFGAPSQTTTSILESISDLSILERLHRRILTASTWAELLASERLG
ncbi:MAG: hypothetical protein IT306_18210 [Chloroflexi bacterium]|nr:hypothetical protein [Chloroflexota bacterium]